MRRRLEGRVSSWKLHEEKCAHTSEIKGQRQKVSDMQDPFAAVELGQGADNKGLAGRQMQV